MHKRQIFLIFLIVMVLVLGGLEEANALPPEPPSVFYGEIHFMPDDVGPTVGDYVYAYVPGVDTPVAEAQIFINEPDTSLVYRIDVPADDISTIEVKEGGITGDLVTFKIADRVVARGTWNSAINQNINFHPPKAIAGGVAGSVLIDQIFTLEGSFTDYIIEDDFYFEWDLLNDGQTDTTEQNPMFSFNTGGLKTINLKVTDGQGGEGLTSLNINVLKKSAVVNLSNLDQVYDGSPKTITCGTLPEGLAVDITYNGSDLPPTAAGSYAVVATVVDDIYEGSAEGTLEITQAPAEISLSNLDQEYDGDPKPVTVTTVPSGISYSITYDGLPDTPSATGAYEVFASITDPNYQPASANGTLVIRATQNITLVPGWNLVSFNVQPYPSKTPGDVLESILGNFDLVYAWDASGGHLNSGHWMVYDNVESTQDTLSELDETLGLWIHVTADLEQTLTVKGFIPTQTTINLQTGANGWNLVGFPSSAAPAPSSVFGDITSLNLVYAYRASDVSGPWKLYDPGAPGYVNNLMAVEAGYGYWVLVSADDEWNVTY